jgi:sarcosine oxidase subunit gamma
MSNTVSALQGEVYVGSATISEAGLRGMITLRADLASRALSKALKAEGLAVPDQRRCTSKGDLACAWMSPDELLIMCPHAAAEALVAKLSKALSAEHALVVNVSDARAVFEVSGPAAREVIAKLSPVDLWPASFQAGQIRRTRLAQVPAAFWMRSDGAIELICFRSVAHYVFDLLKRSARPGAEVGFFAH